VIRRRDGWAPWVGGLLAPCGWVGYLLWVGIETHRIDGYLYLQRYGWYAHFDFGLGTVRTIAEFLGHQSPFAYYLVTAVLLGYLALLVICLVDRQPWQLIVYSAILLMIALGDATYFHTRARFLIPAFPLLIPIAVALARTRTSRAVLVLGTLAVISAYCGGYLELVWRFSF
jgi:hypothetical protein